MRFRNFKWKLKQYAKWILAILTSVLVFTTLSLTLQYGSQKVRMTFAISRALGSRDVNEMVKLNKNTVLIDVGMPTISASSGPVSPQIAIVLVASAPENEERRNLIRETWASRKSLSSEMFVLFFLGRPESKDLSKLRQEALVYGDVIVDDFTESYHALAIKTLRMLKWFLFRTPHVAFLVKTDDDVFVNTDQLLIHLKTLPDEIQSKYFGGVVHSGRSPHTLNPFSKWYVPPTVWVKYPLLNVTTSGDSYPPYAEGNFYIISGSLISSILETSKRIPLFHLEDIYLSGFVVSGAMNLKLSDVPNVYSASALWPRLNYAFVRLYQSPKTILAYHCDNSVELIRALYEDAF